MGDRTRGGSLAKVAAAGAVAAGLAAGSYGVAAAASGGSGSGSGSSATTPSAPSAQRPWGGQRSDETLLTGETEAKVRAAALSRAAGATVVRIETDADGHAAYEAHMVKADGTPVTVYVDRSFAVVGVESR